ncbi:hypothetical protein V3C99_006711 [Haemonchus contortus]|nr:Ankyrin and Sterile alpha motif SAM domain containing protein [Haemonchus contortus]
MSVRVRFSAARPGVAYVGERTCEGSGMAAEILSKPMPPLHKEENFRMDAHTAASIGDVNVIEALLASKKLDPNEKNLSEWTPLLYAAYLGHHNVCTVLIEAGARTDDCNHKGQTPLMMASSCGNLQVVRLLIEQGASVNRADSRDRQALHYAASCSQNVVAETLLQAGADPNAADVDGVTPLMEACASGHELTTLSLLEYGGDPYLKNNRGEDCHAVAGEESKIQQLLNEHIQRRAATAFSSESPRTSRKPRTLEELLQDMNLARLVDKFKAENIDLNLFFDLTDKDFEEMGIAYGPKKRMLTVIDRYRKSGQISCEPLEVEVVPPPPYTTAEDGSQKEMIVSMRYIRQMNDMTKQLAMEALEVARRSNNGDVLRPLIIGIIDSVENITTRIARHQL